MAEFDLDFGPGIAYNPRAFAGPRIPLPPDPLELERRRLTLGALRDQDVLRQILMAEKARELQAQEAFARAAPALAAGGYSDAAVQQALRANPAAAQSIIKQAEAYRKSQSDYEKTRAETEDKRAATKATNAKPAINMAFALSTDPNLTPDKIAAWHKIVAASGLEQYLPVTRFQQWTDPNAARENLRIAGSALFEAEKQAESGRAERKLGAEIPEIQARTNKLRMEFEQGPAELAIKQQNANTSSGQLGLARDQYRNPNAQHVVIDGVAYAFDPRTKTFTPATGPGGVPLPSGPGKPLTETQGNATAFGMRMKDAAQTIAELEQSGAVDPSGIVVRIAGGSGVPGIPLNAAAGAVNPLSQVYKQAQRNWITANLRKESGAAIPESELAAEFVKWFPQPGDRPEVIKAKAESRKIAEQAMSIQAGPGAKNITALPERAAPQAGTVFASMPDPAKFPNRRIEGPDGTVYRSDGKRWVRE